MTCDLRTLGPLSERAQIERVDLVDNLCHTLLEAILGHELDWNIEDSSRVRDEAIAVLCERTGLKECDFYPCRDCITAE